MRLQDESLKFPVRHAEITSMFPIDNEQDMDQGQGFLKVLKWCLHANI
jgi:hypothetical protein